VNDDSGLVHGTDSGARPTGSSSDDNPATGSSNGDPLAWRNTVRQVRLSRAGKAAAANRSPVSSFNSLATVSIFVLAAAAATFTVAWITADAR
jgi:hypothetical protein